MLHLAMQNYLFYSFSPDSKPGPSQTSLEPHSASSSDEQCEADFHQISESEDETDLVGNKTCESQCCQNTLNVYQEKDQNIIKQTKKIQGSRSRQFCVDWYKIYPWLVLCTTQLKAFCAYCRFCLMKKLINTDGDRAFVILGFSNWKKALERLDFHNRSSFHKTLQQL